MPINKGTVTATTYRVEGQPGALDAERFTTAMRKFAFRPINEEKGERSAGGWVSYRDMLNAYVSYEGSTIAPYLFLSLRVDRKRVAPNLLRASVSRKIRELMKERAGRAVSKNEKQALAEQVEADLLRETKVTPTTFDAVWNTASGVLYFASASRSACDAFEQIFGDTFELGIAPAGLLSRAESLSPDKDIAALPPSWWGAATPLAANPSGE